MKTISCCGRAPSLATGTPAKRANAQADTPPTDRIDFSNGVDNAIEALLMPMVDPLVSMVASWGGGAHVDVTVSDQRLRYTISNLDQPGTIEGDVNGRPFHIESNVNPEIGCIHLKGKDLPFRATVDPEGNVETTYGTVGDVEFTETADIADDHRWVTGKFAGEKLRLSMGLSSESGSFIGSGSLGDRPISLTLEDGPNGTLLARQTIGDIEIKHVIEPFTSD